MATVVLFHHVLGLTDGVRAFAERLAVGRHTVHSPDLYQGAIAESLDEGFAIKERLGDDAIARVVDDTLAELPAQVVFAGMSLGVMTAQHLAQTRHGAQGALLYEACVPTSGEWAFGAWPDGVPVQIHGMDDDEFFAHEGDIDAATELVKNVGAPTAELFTYPGAQHLFLDGSLPSYDAAATELVLKRSTALLDRLTT